LDTGARKRSIESDQPWEEAMCLVGPDLIDFIALSTAKKKALMKDLRKRKQALRAQLVGVNQSLRRVDRAVKMFEKKSKR
jgi:hypothetical protein